MSLHLCHLFDVSLISGTKLSNQNDTNLDICFYFLKAKVSNSKHKSTLPKHS